MPQAPGSTLRHRPFRTSGSRPAFQRPVAGSGAEPRPRRSPRLRLALLAAAVAALACERGGPRPRAADAAEPLRSGLWVLAEGTWRPLEDPGRLARLVEDARRIGASDLFVQVYRGGRAWFPSGRADDAPSRALPRVDGLHPLHALLDRAHAAGLRVHAWVNLLYLGTRPSPRVVERLGREAFLVDDRGRSLLDYPGGDVPPPDRRWVRLGTPGRWLDPAHPAVREHLVGVVADLARFAPGLDGIHLDYVRYPLPLPFSPGSRFGVGLDFGYGPAARAAFERWAGRPFARGDAWDAFRRERVSELVRAVRAAIPRRWMLSAAVLAYPDRAYLSAYQDWRTWVRAGLLDVAVPMAYTRDDRLLGHLVRGALAAGGPERVWIGLGAWLHADAPERILVQRALARAAGARTLVYFSYDALADRPRALAALAPPPAGRREGPSP